MTKKQLQFFTQTVFAKMYLGERQLGIIVDQRFYEILGLKEGDTVQLRRDPNGAVDWKPGNVWVPLRHSQSRPI